MKIVFFTLVLDGMPWIACHLPTFNRLSVDWEWRIAEGVAKPKACTAWCRDLEPRLSNDGTTEYLRSIAAHPRVKVQSRPFWNGKIEMVRALTDGIDPGTLVVQVDSDELWTDASIMGLWLRMQHQQEDTEARFFCRYFVGPQLIVGSVNTYGNKESEWARAWKWSSRSRFVTHEPPVVDGTRLVIARESTFFDSIFDHYAYALEKQLHFKEQYYGYRGAVAGWHRLQRHDSFPVPLRQFFPWVKDEALVIPATSCWQPF